MRDQSGLAMGIRILMSECYFGENLFSRPLPSEVQMENIARCYISILIELKNLIYNDDLPPWQVNPFYICATGGPFVYSRSHALPLPRHNSRSARVPTAL